MTTLTGDWIEFPKLKQANYLGCKFIQIKWPDCNIQAKDGQISGEMAVAVAMWERNMSVETEASREGRGPRRKGKVNLGPKSRGKKHHNITGGLPYTARSIQAARTKPCQPVRGEFDPEV